MAIVTARASEKVYDSSTGTGWGSFLDNDVNNSSKVTYMGSKESSAIFGFSNRFNIPSNAIIKRITAFIKISCEKNLTLAARLVKDATSSGGYTDLGDGAVYMASNSTIPLRYYSASFPNAANTISPDFINSGKMQIRAYTKAHGSSSLTSTVVYRYDMYMEVEYELPTYTLTVNASTGGSVTGGGTYESGTSVTLTATPSAGYKFVKWSDGNTNPTRTVTVSGNATYTAQFELDKINKIYVGTQQPKEIYVGTTPIKAIYVGTTKVYG